MNLKNGGSVPLVTDLQNLPSQKQNTSSTQRRMLTKSEIEFLQKNKKDSMEKMIHIFKSEKLIIKVSTKRLRSRKSVNFRQYQVVRARQFINKCLSIQLKIF